MIFVCVFALTSLYERPLYAQSPSSDTSIASIVVNSQPVIRLEQAPDVLTANIHPNVQRATVVVMPNHQGATVRYNTLDLEPETPGLQFKVRPGFAHSFSFEVIADNRVESETFNMRVGRGSNQPFKWKADEDFYNLFSGGQYSARSIWSDGEIMWVSHPFSQRIHAFQMTDKVAAPDSDIALTVFNATPKGVWSDGQTLWVSDAYARRIFAYNIAANRPVRSKYIPLTHENRQPTGIWSDGETIWVADAREAKLFAYKLADGQYRSEADVQLGIGNFSPQEIWSDGTTVWIADYRHPKLFAYRLNDWARVPEWDFDLKFENGFDDSHFPAGVWSDGETMWVSSPADENIYSYNMPDKDNPLRRDATLENLNLEPKDISVFSRDVYRYSIGVSPNSENISISAIPSDTDADVRINDQHVTYGETYRQPLQPGKNRIAVSVTSPDKSTSKLYEVIVGRGVSDAFGWKAVDDFDGFHEVGNQSATDLCSDGETMWITSAHESKLYAFRISDKRRSPELDFDLSEYNITPEAIWTDGQTIWVSETNDNELIAFTLSNKQRNIELDFWLTDENRSADGLWSDGETMWVADYFDGKLYAYDMFDKSYQPEKDFQLPTRNAAPGGIWSDGNIVWVADGDDNNVYAYDLYNQKRLPSYDFQNILKDNEHRYVYAPFGIWSDGETMWVVDESGTKVFSYNMPNVTIPASTDASLASLQVEPTNVTGFETDSRLYAVGVDSNVSQATITATLNDPNAKIDIDGTEILSGIPYTVSLKPGQNDIRVRLTATDGIKTQTYTISITRSIHEPFARNASQDFDTLYTAGNKGSSGIWSNGDTMWVADPEDRRIYAYRMSDKKRDPEQDFNDVKRMRYSTGMWSDGHTLWVADETVPRLNAYRIADKVRDPARDFHLGVENALPTGFWSDGKTMWVGDDEDDYVYAYDFKSQRRIPDRDIVIDDLSPRGIWSNGDTMWVAGADLIAFNIKDLRRDPDKDFIRMLRYQLIKHGYPFGIWSDNETMWVAVSDGWMVEDPRNFKIYAFNMPDAVPPTDPDVASPYTGGISIPLKLLFTALILGALLASIGVATLTRHRSIFDR